MKRIPEKAKFKDGEPIVIKINPSDLKNGIVIPKVTYEVTATVEQEEMFHGMVLPLPKALVYYLSHNELLIFSLIVEETNLNGECLLSVKEISDKLKISLPTISNTLYSLRKSGLLLEAPNGKKGAGRKRKINYQTVQHLNDLVEGEDSGIYVRIRKATRKQDINNITKEDIKAAYDNKVLEPGHDPAEEEEYD